MTGIVIAFPGTGASTKGVRPSRQKHPSEVKRPSQVKAKVDRIALLLAELDNLVPLPAGVSAALTNALATISEVEEKRGKRTSGHSAPATAEDDSDPQPHVNHDVLEGYFQSLNR